MAETARLLVEFLERELELIETIIQHARLEQHGGDVSQAMQHIHQGLDTIRRFLPEVTFPEDRARISEGLERLETEDAMLDANG